jgi:hypothetical protein
MLALNVFHGGLRVSNQEDIIFAVRGMDCRELLDLLVEHPFYMTDAYFARIKDAIRARYQALTSVDRSYYSF